MNVIRKIAVIGGAVAALTAAAAGAANATAAPAPQFSFPTFGTVAVVGHVDHDLRYTTYAVDNAACTGTAFTADCAPQHGFATAVIPAGDYTAASAPITIGGPACGPAQQDVTDAPYQQNITYPGGSTGFLAGGIVQLRACQPATADSVKAVAVCGKITYTITNNGDLTGNYIIVNNGPSGNPVTTVPFTIAPHSTVSQLDQLPTGEVGLYDVQLVFNNGKDTPMLRDDKISNDCAPVIVVPPTTKPPVVTPSPRPHPHVITPTPKVVVASVRKPLAQPLVVPAAPQLASTGSNAGLIGVGGALVVGVGTLLLVASRRRTPKLLASDELS